MMMMITMIENLREYLFHLIEHIAHAFDDDDGDGDNDEDDDDDDDDDDDRAQLTRLEEGNVAPCAPHSPSPLAL